LALVHKHLNHIVTFDFGGVAHDHCSSVDDIPAGVKADDIIIIE
jgi:hypothetical protein